jgi:hypothetical protein
VTHRVERGTAPRARGLDAASLPATMKVLDGTISRIMQGLPMRRGGHEGCVAFRMFRFESRPKLVLAFAAAASLLEGCARPASPVDEARAEFSATAFCPLHRVDAGVLVSIPAPPRKIARDPERYAMWRAAYERRGFASPRQIIAVNGCDEETVVYHCWPLLARESLGRRARSIYLGATCSEQSVPAAPATVDAKNSAER